MERERFLRAFLAGRPTTIGKDGRPRISRRYQIVRQVFANEEARKKEDKK